VLLYSEENTSLRTDLDRLRGDLRASQDHDLYQRLEENRKQMAEMEELVRNLKREKDILKLKAAK